MFRALKFLIIGLFMATGLSAAPAGMPKWQAYSAPVFANAQAAGKTIVVDIYATWCPTCRAQEPILDRLRSEAKLKTAIFIKVDFDKERQFLRDRRIPRQSTILVFKGKRETARSIAETDAVKLRAAILAGA